MAPMRPGCRPRAMASMSCRVQPASGGKAFSAQGRLHFNMLAGGQSRYHAAVQGVEVRLRGNGIGTTPAVRPNPRHTRSRCMFKGKIFIAMLLSPKDRRSPPYCLPGHLAPVPPWDQRGLGYILWYLSQKMYCKRTGVHQAGVIRCGETVQGLVVDAEDLRIMTGGPADRTGHRTPAAAGPSGSGASSGASDSPKITVSLRSFSRMDAPDPATGGDPETHR